MDDAPVFVGSIACRLGFAPTYDQCEVIAGRLAGNFDQYAILGALGDLGLRRLRQPSGKQESGLARLERLWAARSFLKDKPLEEMIQETMSFSKIDRQQAIAELIQKVESAAFM